MNTVEIKAGTDTQEYVFVIQGGVPGILMPSVAYRRTGRPELVGRKLIRCPYCREVLTDVHRHAHVEIYRMPERKTIKLDPRHEYRKCAVCKREVGFLVR